MNFCMGHMGFLLDKLILLVRCHHDGGDDDVFNELEHDEDGFFVRW